MVNGDETVAGEILQPFFKSRGYFKCAVRELNL